MYNHQMNLQTSAIYQEFVTYLKVSGYSDSYSKRVIEFLIFCQNLAIDYENVTYTDFNNFMLQLKNENRRGWDKDQGLSGGYINNKLKAIRAFYKFLILSKGIGEKADIEIRKFKLVTAEFKVKIYATPEELLSAMRKVMSYCRINPYKIQAVLCFMFYTGLRPNELCQLKRQDIKLTRLKAIIRVPRKNKREYVVNYPKRVAKYMELYFRQEPETENAFNMSIWKIRYLVGILNGYLPKEKNFTPRSLRHSFAMMLADNEVDIRYAQEMLGHANMTSTMVYYNPTDKHIEKVYHKKITGEIKPQPEEEENESNAESKAS